MSSLNNSELQRGLHESSLRRLKGTGGGGGGVETGICDCTPRALPSLLSVSAHAPQATFLHRLGTRLQRMNLDLLLVASVLTSFSPPQRLL